MSIASAAKSFLSSIVAKLQKWMAILAMVLPIFLLIEIIIVLAVSSGKNCVQSYQFDTENRQIDAKPVADGIFGSGYNHVSGGETAGWHNTGLRTDGGPLTFEIRGGWTAWDDAVNDAQLAALPECTMCAKRDGVHNCICGINQEPEPELNDQGNALSVNCSDITNQEDPTKCSCTKQHGTINEIGTYFIATDYQDKNGDPKASDQQESCRYTRGEGLYVGLFGKNGNTMPIRVYQLYPTREICDINRNSQGQCVDDSGNDQTKYLYTSPNGKIFIKDDKNGNSTIDSNPNDDEYHTAGELIKMIINDRYYHDNYGGYDVEFMGGFLREGDKGLLEYVVGTVEDTLMGKVNADKKTRSGGALEFLYNSIIKDSTFIRIVQMCLILYITIFGIYVLVGAVQISRKELIKRIIKIALVIFFTDVASWYWYDQFVVGMFKYGMDSVISMFMNISDQSIDTNSLIVASQLDRANDVSQATRFSYIDSIIKKLLSESSTKKIWGLFFGEWFGMVIIPLIYVLIGYFILTMLTAAFVYIQSLLKLIMVLALGPIFMITALYDKTDEIFKRWISFMGARSVEIICTFLVLYLFIILIDKNFTEMLLVEACPLIINFGLFNIGFIKTTSDRGLVGWIVLIFETGALLWLLNMIIKQIPGFAGQMVIINKQKADTSKTYIASTNNSAFALAGAMMGNLTKTATTAINRVAPAVAQLGLSGIGKISRATGFHDALDKVGKKLPFRSPVSIVRDAKIDDVISQKQALGKSQGKTGAELDKFVRDETKKTITAQNKLTVGKQSWKGKDDSLQLSDKILQATSDKTLQAKFLGIDDASIQRRLDKKLIEDPFKQLIKDESKAMKAEKGADMPLGKEELHKAMRDRISGLADDKYSKETKDGFLKLLDQQKYGSMLKKHGELTSTEAAKIFSGNEQGTQKYLQHLQDRQYEKELKKKETSDSIFKNLTNAAKDVGRSLQRNTAYNPKMARENFLRKEQYEREKKANDKLNEKSSNIKSVLRTDLNKIGTNADKSGIRQRINVLDKFSKRDNTNKMAQRAQIQSLANYLKDGHKKDLENIKKNPLLSGKEREKALQLLEDKRHDFQQNLVLQIKNENKNLMERMAKAEAMIRDIHLPEGAKSDHNKYLEEAMDARKEYEDALKYNTDIMKDLLQSANQQADDSGAQASSATSSFTTTGTTDDTSGVEAGSASTTTIEPAITDEQKNKAFGSLLDIFDKQGKGEVDGEDWESHAASLYEGSKALISDKLLHLRGQKSDIDSKINALKAMGKLSHLQELELQQLEKQSSEIDSGIESTKNELDSVASKIDSIKKK